MTRAQEAEQAAELERRLNGASERWRAVDERLMELRRNAQPVPVITRLEDRAGYQLGMAVASLFRRRAA